MPKESTVLFLAETNAREATVKEEALKHDPAILKDYKFIFKTYQSKKCEEPVDVIIADEVHCGLTKEYSWWLNIDVPKICLSGTIPNTEVDEIETKHSLLDRFAPILYDYNMNQSIDDDINRGYTIYVVKHEPDPTEFFTVSYGKNYKKPFPEPSALVELYAQMSRNESNPFLRNYYANQVTEYGYTANSKLPLIQTILEQSGKTIVFNPRLSFLEKLTPNVIKDKHYKDIIDNFVSGSINVIASAKKLSQGITLPGLESIIISGFNRDQVQFEQMIGRVIRKTSEGNGRVFAIVTKHTFESRWFKDIVAGTGLRNIYSISSKEVTAGANIREVAKPDSSYYK